MARENKMKKLIHLSGLVLALFSVACSPKNEAADPIPAEPQAWEWQQVANFNGQAQRGSMAFAIDNAAYVVSGMGSSFVPHRECWKYDAGANAWTRKADFPGTAVIEGVGFTIASKGYLCLGSTNGSAGPVNALWEYEPATNLWTQKTAFPGAARSGSVALVINQKAYILAGSSSLGSEKDVWEYDPLTGHWTQKGDFPGAGRFLPAGFVINGRGYVGTGVLGGPPFSAANDFWEYDPAADIWTRKADFPGTARGYALGFSINNKGYLGMGMTNIDNAGVNMVLARDIWEYDPTGNSWVARGECAGQARAMAVGFVLGSYMYIGGGNNAANQNLLDFWRMRPAQ
jgi:N-acetylneuraminic acid mutarotase